jgi:hypothetical protein
VSGRIDDIAEVARQLHGLMDDVTPQWSAYLAQRFRPEMPYDRRIIVLAIRAYAGRRLSGLQLVVLLMRLVDSAYGSGAKSFRTQGDIAYLLGCSKSAVEKADRAIIGCGLATRQRWGPAAARHHLANPEELDRLAARIGLEMLRRPTQPELESDRRPTQPELESDRRPTPPELESDGGAFLSRTAVRQTYTQDVSKKARAPAHGRERVEPGVLDGAVASWVLRGDAGWGPEYRAMFGNSPEYDDPRSRIYDHNASALHKALAYARLQVRKREKGNDAYIRTRLETFDNRLAEKERGAARRRRRPPAQPLRAFALRRWMDQTERRSGGTSYLPRRSRAHARRARQCGVACLAWEFKQSVY